MHARRFEHVDGARRIRNRFRVRAVAGLAGRNDPQVAKPHGFDGAGGRTDVARMGGFTEDESNASGKLGRLLHFGG